MLEAVLRRALQVVFGGGFNISVANPLPVSPKTLATTPTKYALALTLANTQYSQILPANTKQFSVHLRDMTEFRLAYEANKVAAPTDPYETVPAGSEKYVEGICPPALTLYLASPVAAKTAEIEAWS